MGKPIAGINKLPFGIDGIKITCAILPNGEIKKDLFIYKQRSHNIYDLIDRDGIIHQFYKITVSDKKNNPLPFEITKFDEYLEPNTFCVKAYHSCNVVGYVQKFLLNKIVLGDGSIVGATLSECEIPYIVVENVSLIQKYKYVELEREFNLFDNFALTPENSSPESLNINIDESFIKNKPGIYSGTELGCYQYTTTTQNGLGEKSGYLIVTPVQPKLITKPEIFLDVYDEPVEMEVELVDYNGTDTDYVVEMRSFDHYMITYDKINKMRINPFSGGKTDIYAETVLDLGTSESTYVQSNQCIVTITEPPIKLTEIIIDDKLKNIVYNVDDSYMDLYFSVYPSHQTTTTKYWYIIEDPSIVEISYYNANAHTFSFTPLKVGKTKIRVESLDEPNISNEFNIEIVQITDIFPTLYKSTTNLHKGLFYPIIFDTIPKITHRSFWDIKLESSDTTIATTDRITDSVIPVNVGNATITVDCLGFKKSFDISVLDKTFSSKQHDLILNKDEEYKLMDVLREHIDIENDFIEDYSIRFTWVSGDVIVGGMTQRRLLAIDEGRTTININSPKNKMNVDINIRVVSGLKFNSKINFVEKNSDMSIDPSELIILDNTINPNDIIMYSSNDDIVKIVNDNYVFGKPGIAQIFAEVKNTNYKISKTFVVVNEYVQINKVFENSSSMSVGFVRNKNTRVDESYCVYYTSPTIAENNIIEYEFNDSTDPMIPFIHYHYDVLERKNTFFVQDNDLISDDTYEIGLNMKFIDNEKYKYDMVLYISYQGKQ